MSKEEEYKSRHLFSPGGDKTSHGANASCPQLSAESTQQLLLLSAGSTWQLLLLLLSAESTQQLLLVS
jgi:hypothetical protein